MGTTPISPANYRFYTPLRKISRNGLELAENLVYCTCENTTISNVLQ